MRMISGSIILLAGAVLVYPHTSREKAELYAVGMLVIGGLLLVWGAIKDGMKEGPTS